jgi:U3 small nucleolar RNA-associated protein 7
MSKNVQTLSFGDENTSTLKPSQTTANFNRKRKEVVGGFDAADVYNREENDTRTSLEIQQDNNKRMKKLEFKKETLDIQASSHNRLKGGLNQTKIDSIKNNTHRAHMRTNEKLARETSLHNAYAERFLQPSQQGFVSINDKKKILTTRHLKQADLYQEASDTVKAKAFTLSNLEYGAYHSEYTSNGAFMLLCGDRGHVNILDWRNGQSILEKNVQEEIFDATFLQDHTLYALAQKRHVCLYDSKGVKIHHLKHESMQFPRKLQYLPYHFLLATGTQHGMLSWRDITTGEIVSNRTTSMGPVCALRQNPQNAVLHAGHNSGLVTLWTPNMPKPVVTMNCILNGQVNDIAIDDSGNYMYVCGSEGSVKLWDLRKYETLATTKLHRPATTCDVSHTGLVAFGSGPHTTVYKRDEFQMLGNDFKQTHLDTRGDVTRLLGPYLHETFGGQIIRKLRFVPYEDLLGMGTQRQFQHLIIPGAGSANFDSWVANPFENSKQRQERVVKGLLEKLQPDMITLDNRAFSVMSKKDQSDLQKNRAEQFKKSLKHDVDLDKKRMKGRNGATKSEKRKAIGIVEENRDKFQEHLEEKRAAQREKNREEQRQRDTDQANGVVKSALDRFL